MSDNANEKEKKCLFCKKKLIDETVHICLRCRLEGRDNVVGLALVLGGGVALKFFSDKAQGDANSDDDSDSDSDDEDD